MRSAERILASDDVEEKGLACALLGERYYKAALYAFTLDRTVIPYLKGELRKRAAWYAKHERWSDKTTKAIEPMICIAIYDLERGGQTNAESRAAAVPIVREAIRSWRKFKRATAKEKAQVVGCSRATWFRHYAKPYEALYGDLVGWAYVGRAHVFRKANEEELG